MPDTHSGAMASESLVHTLYALIGESVWKVQLLEDTLNHALVLKTIPRSEKNKADEQLSKHRRKTLGQSLKLIDNEKLLSEKLRSNLIDFKSDRNWLIHRSMLEKIDSLENGADPSTLFLKIKKIADTAHDLQVAAETELIDYCKSNGMDLEVLTRQLIEKYGAEKIEKNYSLTI